MADKDLTGILEELAKSVQQIQGDVTVIGGNQILQANSIDRNQIYLLAALKGIYNQLGLPWPPPEPVDEEVTGPQPRERTGAQPGPSARISSHPPPPKRSPH